MTFHVLIVDDEPSLRRTLERALTLEGYTVSTASGADSAYALLQEIRADAVLLDLRMPTLTGDALAVAMLHRWPYLAGRILFMSGDPCAARDAWPAELRECPILGKPFGLDALARTIAALIAGAEVARKHGNGHS